MNRENVGDLATPETLVLRWDEMTKDPSILTRIGIRVADVAWAGPDFLRSYGEITPYRRAPEICVEIVSPSNTKTEMQEKTRAYLDSGAAEVWLVSEEGGIRYFGPEGEIAASGLPISVTLPPPVK